MAPGRFRLLFAMSLGLVALVCAGTAGAAQPCASRLLADWQDGRIDHVYPVSCYRTALADLPEDVRVYSSAQTDITRALQGRLARAAAKSAAPKRNSDRHGVSPLLVAAITAAILVAAGSIAAAVR